MGPGDLSGAQVDFAIAGGIPHFVAAKVGAVGLCDRDLVRSAAGIPSANGLESIFPHRLAGGGGQRDTGENNARNEFVSHRGSLGGYNTENWE
jgi:hypothetical protein